MTEMQELARWKYYHDWEEAPGSDYYIGPEGNGSLDKAIAVRLSLENAIAVVDAHNYRHSQAILTLERERDEARAANAALMRERAETIKTKHEQIGKLQLDLQCVRELASDDAEEWRRSVAAADAQVQALRDESPIAWRFRQRGMTLWQHMSDRPPIGIDGMPDGDYEVEPLYARAALRSEP